MKVLPVLMAGGSGTRLWPLSREYYPKQFLPLLGERSLLQATALRAAALENAHAPMVICGEAHRFIVAEQLQAVGVAPSAIILEPEGRNTAPAAAAAAYWALQHLGDDVLIFLMSADQAVDDVAAFTAAAGRAAALAGQGWLMTFGIRPTRPETGFGYLRAGKALDGGGFAVAEFVEKPDTARAEAFLADGGYYWNGGLFLFQARAFLDELNHFEPEMCAACAQAVQQARADLDFVRLDADSFATARADSIDYALMERTDHAALVPLDAGWDDVGSWSFAGRNGTADAAGNHLHGDVMVENSRDCLVRAEGRLVALVGMQDCIVVETRDAVLVAAREQAQEVKRIVERLRAQGRSEALHHTRVYRPWGWYEGTAEGERFQVKRIMVKPGQRLSLQKHHHRAEHWVVVRGTARITRGDESFLLSEDQSTYIPLGAVHRLENPGHIPLELIEVQSGAYLGEDDIVRLEDDFGR